MHSRQHHARKVRSTVGLTISVLLAVVDYSVESLGDVQVDVGRQVVEVEGEFRSNSRGFLSCR